MTVFSEHADFLSASSCTYWFNENPSALSVFLNCLLWFGRRIKCILIDYAFRTPCCLSFLYSLLPCSLIFSSPLIKAIARRKISLNTSAEGVLTHLLFLKSQIFPVYMLVQHYSFFLVVPKFNELGDCL